MPDWSHLSGLSRRCYSLLDETIEAHLDRIRSAGQKLKPAKCSLFADQVLYFGHLISASGVSPDPAKL